jgi:hypothetical protein
MSAVPAEASGDGFDLLTAGQSFLEQNGRPLAARREEKKTLLPEAPGAADVVAEGHGDEHQEGKEAGADGEHHEA